MLQVTVHLHFPAYRIRRKKLLFRLPVQATHVPQVPPHQRPA
jgi:hypothetical protein